MVLRKFTLPGAGWRGRGDGGYYLLGKALAFQQLTGSDEVAFRTRVAVAQEVGVHSVRVEWRVRGGEVHGKDIMRDVAGAFSSSRLHGFEVGAHGVSSFANYAIEGPEDQFLLAGI